VAYEFDLFISYRRKKIQMGWLRDQFLPIFLAKLEDETLRVAQRPLGQIFLDVAETDAHLWAQLDQFRNHLVGIRAGTDWKTELRYAIPRGRCLLALWSPTYFVSEWCLAEWEHYASRPSGSFAVPITVHDCENPTTLPMAREVNTSIQAIRFNTTYYVGGAFEDDPRYLELQDLCGLLARRVAECIGSAGDDFLHSTELQDLPDDEARSPQIAQRRMSDHANRRG
jgi:hypothetical protein